MNASQEWCNWAVPPGKYNKIPSNPDLARYNVYGGFDVTADRLAHIDGGKFSPHSTWGVSILTVLKVPRLA